MFGNGAKLGVSADRQAFIRTRAGKLFPREDAVLAGVVTIIIALAGQVVENTGYDMPGSQWFWRNARLYLLICGLIVLAETTIRLLIERPSSPLRYLLSPGIANLLAHRVFAMVPIMAVALLMPAFSAVKSSIGRINPFDWDATFITLDQAIHGTDPWRLLHPVMGHPAVTYLASNLYHIWFLLIYLGPVLFAFYLRDRQLRLSFFFSYVATWTVVGMIFAMLFASVGPCFVGPIFGNAHFAEQMVYLQQADRIYPLAVLDVQQQLLDWYRVEDAGLGRGITAMPSMHVALAWLYVLVTWRIDRRLGYVFAAFFVAILLSSVHLAYHYAVDGYVAVALVTAIWFLCRRAATALAPPLAKTDNPITARKSKTSEFLNLSAIFTLFRPRRAASQAGNGTAAK